MEHDFLIIGGGVIGLSVAWELVSRGQQVCIVDRQEFGRETSWVGAGIFPPALSGAKHDALEQLRHVSHKLHRDWSERLIQESGIDNELRVCGGIYVARNDAEAASLRVSMQWAADDGVTVQELTQAELGDAEPALQPLSSDVKAAFRLPHEMQLRSPRHLRALTKTCSQAGITMLPNVVANALGVEKGRVTSIETDREPLSANEVILCCGPWIEELLSPAGFSLPIEPWRGQLILWKTEERLVKHVINEGLRYLVPREDGHLLAGATVEDVGFDATTTDEAIEELTEYAISVLPALGKHKIERAFAGLRPKTPDGLPFMGRVPGFENLSVATGHYRSGLHLSTGTAVFMADHLLHDTPPANAHAFRLSR